MDNNVDFKKFPSQTGHFGEFGGRFVAETLMPLIIKVEKEYLKAKKDKSFKKQQSNRFKSKT